MKCFSTESSRDTHSGSVCELVVGYLIFARNGGGYMNPIDLFFPGSDLFSQIGDTLSGAERARRNVLLSGVIGAVVGAAFRLGQGYRGR